MDLPDLTPEERQAMDSIDLTPVLGTVEHQLQVAQQAALRYFRERNDYRARHETSLEVIRAREQDVDRLRREVERLQQESDRFRVALMHYAERNYWGYSEPLSPNKIEDLFIPSRATGEPGWQRAEEALK
jgi:hypothetical protein